MKVSLNEANQTLKQRLNTMMMMMMMMIMMMMIGFTPSFLMTFQMRKCLKRKKLMSNDVNAQQDEVLTYELPKKQRFMGTDVARDKNTFHSVPEQPQETFKWKN